MQSVNRRDPHPLRDFFIADSIPGLVDYAPKDSQEMMERPFFAISKRKRNKPIEYTSPDGNLWIKVEANPLYGMASIWDADILIYAVSRLLAQQEPGQNFTDRIIHTTPYELLRGIARGTGGADYKELMAAITRLSTTRVETNIRAGKRRYVSFHYLGDIEGQGEIGGDEQLKSISLRLPDWLLAGLSKSTVLTLDKEYFLLKGGIERAIYRAARKHAGAQPQGWTCRMAVLHQKTGSEAQLKKFAFKVRELVERDELPRYAMTAVKTEGGEAAVHFVDRRFVAAEQAEERRQGAIIAGRDAARMAWIDGEHNPRDFQRAYEQWCEYHHPRDFVANLTAPRLPL